MKFIILLFTLTITAASNSETNRREKITSYYKEIYHRTYRAASNDFLNNFIGRKNVTAHALAYPTSAYLQAESGTFTFSGNNYIYLKWLNKTKRAGYEKREFFEYHLALMEDGTLCNPEIVNYKRPNQLLRTIFDHLNSLPEAE